MPVPAQDLDVLVLGEALVDFLPEHRGTLLDAGRFGPCPGGAPANVATGLARLGARVGFRGVVGDDPFGRFLAVRLAAEGIACDFRFARERPTGCWFIALDAKGDRSFFSPNARFSADKLLAPSDVEPEALGRAAVLHVGTSAHALPAGQDALRAAVAAAAARGVRVSFDPNVRAHLWDDLAPLRRLCADVLPQVTYAKVSEEEAEVCTGEADPARAAARLVDMGVAVACLTLGSRGALVRRGNETAHVPAEPVEVVDTTGAGDGFVAGLLSTLARRGDPRELPFAEVVAAVAFANRVAGRVCTRLGAVAGLPRADEISV